MRDHANLLIILAYASVFDYTFCVFSFDQQSGAIVWQIRFRVLFGDRDGYYQIGFDSHSIKDATLSIHNKMTHIEHIEHIERIDLINETGHDEIHLCINCHTTESNNNWFQNSSAILHCYRLILNSLFAILVSIFFFFFFCILSHNFLLMCRHSIFNFNFNYQC